VNEHPLETWHRLVRTQDPSGLDSLLAEEAVFYSPVVHVPQRGKEIDGVLVNGVDLIKWNDTGKIVEFKVMIRPLKAINLIHQRMAAMLQSKQGAP
jgi:hypothetical protein